ncbi:hypothetical protein BDR26DRAFT_833285 [Obelidium mucronatum]|nr:hypothetical protein BDR26DRAFT_833285 [Obelidium mucronatum]
MLAPNNPPFPFHRGADIGGFAHPTVVTRWPVIVTDAINAVLRAAAADARRDGGEGGRVVARLSQLKYELQREKPLTRLAAAAPRAAAWNAAVDAFFPAASFFTASWLFAECFLYQRIHEAVESQPSWKGFDVFLESKQAGFRVLSDKVAVIAESQQLLISSAATANSASFRSTLHDLVLLSLWGNATDLSMFAGLSEAQVEEMRKGASGEENIISNHLKEIVDYVETAFPVGGNGRLDFVLDNSGFEHFSDMILSDFLHQTGRVSKTVFHCKTIPWFVSDTMPADFEWTLNALEDPLPFFFPDSQKASSVFPVEALQALASRWRQYIASGHWVITSDDIWCSFWAHHHLATEAPHVFEDLLTSQLVIFKGDLNYRKLVYDCKFPATTPFADAIGDVKKLKAIVSLRTNKSDPIVGLAEGVEEKLLAEGNKDWRWSGKLAVVEFFKSHYE